MSIVIRGAPVANSGRTKLPTTYNPAGVDVVDHPADAPPPTPQDGFGFTARSPTASKSPPDARKYIRGYEQLSKLGVGFYPIHPDKSPAVEGKLDREVTTDPFKIQYWAKHLHHRNFALRILRGSPLMVIDTESPFKHPGKLGPDGEMLLYRLLEEHDITLPPGPMVQSATGGFHRSLLVPRGCRIRSSIGLWPGIDILAMGSNVILPESRTEAGQYRALRSFDECPIPEAPRAFIKLIRQAQKTKLGLVTKASQRVPDGDRSLVSRQQWWLLFRNRVFGSFWRREGKVADASDSAYEYHLAKACFCCGLNQRQTTAVILMWRQKHGLERSPQKLRQEIIPAAWREVSPWVDQWHAKQATAKEARQATKTSNMILAYIKMAGQPQTPSLMAAALPIPKERAKKAMQRMAKDGKLQRTKSGYTVADTPGTFCRITTPYSGKQSFGECSATPSALAAAAQALAGSSSSKAKSSKSALVASLSR